MTCSPCRYQGAGMENILDAPTAYCWRWMKPVNTDQPCEAFEPDAGPLFRENQNEDIFTGSGRSS